MPLTIQEYTAAATEKKAQDILAAACAVPDDKRDWKPFGTGRTVLDLIAECAITNAMSIGILQERAWDESGRMERRKAQAALDTLEKASASLEENTRSLVAAIRAIPDDHLELEIALPGETSTVAEDIFHSYWNMAYHGGQINYIHSLCGAG